MFLKKEDQSGAGGQASLEYLLATTAVFVAFAGTALLFSRQVEGYLSFLSDWIILPF